MFFLAVRLGRISGSVGSCKYWMIDKLLVYRCNAKYKLLANGQVQHMLLGQFMTWQPGIEWRISQM